jgi:hypothetical protein
MVGAEAISPRTVQFMQRRPEQLDGSALRHQDSGKQPQQGRLTAAARTADKEPFPRADVERQPVKDRRRAFLPAETDLL